MFFLIVNLISILVVFLNLCIVSLDRYFVIVYLFKYEVFVMIKMIVLIIGVVWFYVFFVVVLLLMGWYL